MRLIKSNQKYELYEIDSKFELNEYIRKHNGNLLASESDCKAYLVKYIQSNTKTRKYIGFTSGDFGLSPRVEIIEIYNMLTISCDDIFYIVDTNNNKEKKNLKCSSLIYYYCTDQTMTTMYIICELDIVCININGQVLWEKNFKDIITNYKINKEYIELLIDNVELKLSLSDGDII